MEEYIETPPNDGNPIAGELSVISALKELSKVPLESTMTIYLFGNGDVQLCVDGYMPANYHF